MFAVYIVYLDKFFHPWPSRNKHTISDTQIVKTSFISLPNRDLNLDDNSIDFNLMPKRQEIVKWKFAEENPLNEKLLTYKHKMRIESWDNT